MKCLQINTDTKPGVGLTKRQIRNKMLQRLRSQKEDERERKSCIIQQKLFRLKAFKKAERIMLYLSFAGEVKTDNIIKEAQRAGKKIFIPVCDTKTHTIKPSMLISGARFKKGPYGIPEPLRKIYGTAEDLDIVIVPGLAFDMQGNRLGRGKGYYDRFLKGFWQKTYSIGLAFDFQILPCLPTTENDLSVDKVLFA
jgi:5-formyltetrahydrofolate cyclo-ligase